MTFNTNSLNHEFDNSLVSNNFGFLRLPLNFTPYDSDAEVVITGVPFDMATSGRSGTRFGPEGIRRASVNLAWEECRYPWNFNVREALNIIDCGDLVYGFGDSNDMVAKLTAHTLKVVESGKKTLTFGGDHFITLPLLRAHAKVHGKMALVHFDAHSDTYATGTNCDHGTMFFHAPKEGLIDPSHSVQIGIRTEYHDEDNFNVIHGQMANDLSVKEICDIVKEKTNGMKVYLTFDIDCLDPAYAPGTGTPVVGGLSTDKIMKILQGLKDLDIVGADVVEVAPAYDNADITSLAGASIALQMLYMFATKKMA